MGLEGESVETQTKLPIFVDIRRYYCEFCGICRSKKSLLASHLITHHKDEMNQKSTEGDGEKEASKSNTCEECGANFPKPAYLKQHMLSHSLERPFSCPIDDCNSSYRRKDHLNRHMLQHEGKLFLCPVENCSHKFSFQGNMTRHVHEFHDEESSSSDSDSQKKGKLFLCPVENCGRKFSVHGNMRRHVYKFHDGESSSCGSDSQEQHVCLEDGCGKVFKYASKLEKHKASHVKLKTIEVFCSEPGCMKPFTNEECLKAHIESFHQYINCEICGSKQLKRNIRRHLCSHEVVGSSERIGCSFKGCSHTFSNRSNLQKHVKAVHLALRPFTCRIADCDMRFSFKHVRNHHEKSSCHVYTHGDFEETDDQFRSRPRGGQKRKCPSSDALMRKRVVPPNPSDSILNQGSEFLSWMLSAEDDDQE